jgi:hypothetical protein
MAKIYLITGKATGPCGHGEPGSKYITLADDGVWELGKPYPAFTTREAAEGYLVPIDKYGRYRITELELVE